jgi:hypothetical protein
MCGGPVGVGQSYWGLIQIKIETGAQMTEAQLNDFKVALNNFLLNSGLPNNASASLANGTIKSDANDQDGTSIRLLKVTP